jgi:hypothetical protein
MQRRRPQHEIRAGLTGVDAIQECADVLGFRVLAPFCQAVIHGFEADVMTTRALVDASPHLIADRVRHRSSLDPEDRASSMPQP